MKRIRFTEEQIISYIESFNGRMCDELLNESLFIDLVRPASSSTSGQPTTTPRGRIPQLGYKTPAAYAGTLTAPKGVTTAEALAAAG